MENNLRIFLFVLLLFFSFAADAQQSDTGPNSPNPLVLTYLDSSNSSLEKWKRSRDFNYITYLDSLLRKTRLKADTVRMGKQAGERTELIEKEESSWLANIFNFKGANGFFWVLALLFIGWILYKVFIQSGFFFPVKKSRNSIQEAGQEQELKEMHIYDGFIAGAEKEGKYNLATRYWYLKTLKNLKDMNRIHYSPDKTNREYLFELNNSPLQEPFRELTRHYEYVWYGEFFLQEARYQSIKILFQAFNQEVENIA